MSPTPLASLAKLLIPAAIAALTAYGALAVERDHNAQTRVDVQAIMKAAPAEAAWHQHVDDRLDETRAALNRIEHAVGSK